MWEIENWLLGRKEKSMDVRYGEGKTEYGPGVSIDLDGSEVAIAIDAYLVSHNIFVGGPRTITVNGELCDTGRVYVDPSGFVIDNGERMSGRGPNQAAALDRQKDGGQ